MVNCNELLKLYKKTMILIHDTPDMIVIYISFLY